MDRATLIGGDGFDRILVTGGGTVAIDAGEGVDIVRAYYHGTDYDIVLGSGSDLLQLNSFDFHFNADGSMRVSDFVAGDAGDMLGFNQYLARLLIGWDHVANPFSTGFLQLVDRGGDAVLRLDWDGGGTTAAFQDIVVFAASPPMRSPLGIWAATPRMGR